MNFYNAFLQPRPCAPQAVRSALLGLLLSSSLMFGPAAWAQASSGKLATTPTTANPADPAAPIETARAPKALQHYKPSKLDAPVSDWSASNRRVHEAGGWRAYAKEAAAAKPASAPRGHSHAHHGETP